MANKNTKNKVRENVNTPTIVNTKEYGEVEVTEEEIVSESEIANDFEALNIVQSTTMTLETFLNHHFLTAGKKLYYLKTFGKDKEQVKTFNEWSLITNLV